QRRRPNPPGYNTLVGLDGKHKAARKALLAAHVQGAPCPRCGLPMYSTLEAARTSGLPRHLWALDLGDWPGRFYGGPQTKRLEHASGNRAAGARLPNSLRRSKRPPRRRSPQPPARKWVTQADRLARW